MSMLLRKIRFTRWLQPQDLSWLSKGEIQADPLGDLATIKNDLSVWEIDDRRTNLETVLLAYALSMGQIDDLSYKLIDDKHIASMSITVKATEVPTKVKGASLFHRDLIALSAQKLVELAKILIAEGETGNILRKRIFELIDAGINSGQIEKSKLSSQHLAQYNEFKATQA